ncbi:class I tRNA ligase family protein [Streptomyces sp. NBC_01294]|uniref:class I tRNA ligase family protein n=1 Tax=Streptomyces sp. NBC_01294 TaxID=2903815 RepID=UPI002DDB6842|nr:class I tRNA ligase family protein [Streptomyces sp. NBC_01294]WRZ58277.1 class I tRNA ligase family protein [Streptomyces sp. NBC_01294]
MTRRTVIIAPPPTPNGDLHTGHLAGPYLAGDVHARYLRASGRPVIFTSGTDDSQTYVVSSAARAGLTPEELALRSATQIRATLEAAGISVDGFAPFDKGYRQTVIDFVTDLHSDGAFRLKTVRLPYVEATGEYLMEGLVAGDCPVCLLESRGGLCESCGHPNNFDELLHPRSTVDPDAVVTHREAQILVLPMEEYRDRLADYYVRHRDVLRPHTAQLVREALERPLPDFPITYPTGWGIPAPFTETPGQVLNAWAEGMAASMYCTWYAAEQLGEHADRFDEHWLSEHGIELVYFLGFDNVYFWGMTHLALLMAHGARYVEPHAIVSNEFYELENQKFSTSKGHVVWAADLVAEVPRDLVRFYLALTAPEHSRTNFSREALATLASSRLVEPWNRLAGRLDELQAAVPADALLEVSETGAAHAAIVVERFRSHYELESFSLHRAADLVVVHLDRLLKQADRVAADVPGDLGDLVLAVRTLTACAAPLLVDLAARAERAGVGLTLPAGPVAAAPVAPLRLPLLSTEVGAFESLAVPVDIRA